MNSETSNKDQGRTHPDVPREYRNDEIVVYWEPKLCIHTGNCFRGLPMVFQPQVRPWVLVNAGSSGRHCPGGDDLPDRGAALRAAGRRRAGA